MPALPQITYRVCPHCDGFATAFVDTGRLWADGSRMTVPVDCTACGGYGVRPVTTYLRALAQIGR